MAYGKQKKGASAGGGGGGGGSNRDTGNVNAGPNWNDTDAMPAVRQDAGPGPVLQAFEDEMESSMGASSSLGGGGSRSPYGMQGSGGSLYPYGNGGSGGYWDEEEADEVEFFEIAGDLPVHAPAPPPQHEVSHTDWRHRQGKDADRSLKDDSGTYKHLAPRHDQYAGEFENAGFRGLAGAYTLKNTEEDQKRMAVDVGEDGLLMQGGEKMDTSEATHKGAQQGFLDESYIFAMSDKGDFQAADEGKETGRGTAEYGARRAVEKADLPGFADEEVVNMDARPGFMNHSSFWQGEAVGGAGEMKVKDGKLKHLTPSSGHYTPGLDQVTNTVSSLRDKGANLDDALVDVAKINEYGSAETEQRVVQTNTFHSGEILAAEGHLDALQSKKAMLEQLKMATDPDSLDEDQVKLRPSDGYVDPTAAIEGAAEQPALESDGYVDAEAEIAAAQMVPDGYDHPDVK